MGKKENKAGIKAITVKAKRENTKRKRKKKERKGKPLLGIERDQGGNEVRKEFADAIASSAETCYTCEKMQRRAEKMEKHRRRRWWWWRKRRW